MKTTISVLLCVGATSLLAADPPEVSFGPFPLPLKCSYVVSANAEPVQSDPWTDHYLSRVNVALEDTRSIPSHAGRYGYFSTNLVTVYDIASGAKVSSRFLTIINSVERLQRLLNTRPTGVLRKGYPRGRLFLAYEDLPDFPDHNAAHIVQSKVQFVDYPWGSGIFYITGYAQGVGDTLTNDRMVYRFQGITKDNRFYVSASFRITHPAVGKPIAHVPPGLRENEVADENMAVLLPKEPDNAFTPSLRKLRDFMGTWTVAESKRR